MTNYTNIASIVNARGYETTNAKQAERLATDYDGLQVTAQEQDAWLGSANDQEIATWLEPMIMVEREAENG